MSPAAFDHARFPIYHGPVYLDGDTAVGPIAPIEGLLDFRRRFSRIVIPIAPPRRVTFRKIQGATRGAGRDFEHVVAHSPDPSFGKSHHVGLYDARSREKSTGRGSYGEPGCDPFALYFHPL